MRTNVIGAMRLPAVVCALAVVSLVLSPGMVRAQDTPAIAANFKFTKIDFELLQRADQVDQEFDRKGLVFNDPDAAAYIEEIGKKVAPEAPLENVKWRFRILRDAQP